MKLIIEIPRDDYEYIKRLNAGYTDYQTTLKLYHAVRSSIPLEDIKADIARYEADCLLADDSKECKECDKIVFSSIYDIIDRHIGERSKDGINMV